MGARSPDSPDPGAPARRKKAVRLHASCKVKVGREPIRGGSVALCPEELRFHTGRTGRRGVDFFVHLRFDQIEELAADGPAGTLTVKTEEHGVVVFFLGRLAVPWKELIEERPDLLRQLGIAERSRVAVVGVHDDELEALLEKRVPGFASSGGELDVILAGVEHRADLARLAELAARVRPGAGVVWAVYPEGGRAVDEREILDAARAAGLTGGPTVALPGGRLALKLSRFS